MLNIKYIIVVDFAHPNKTNTILVAKNDTNSRIIRFVLLDNGRPLDTTDVTVVTVKGVNASGSKVYDSAEITVDAKGAKINEIEYMLPSALSAVSGKTTLTLTLMADGVQLTSFDIYINVDNELYDENEEASESDMSGFRDLLNRVMAAATKVENMAQLRELPNPNPIRIKIGNTLYSYNGKDTVEVVLEEMPFLGARKVGVTAIGWEDEA